MDVNAGSRALPGDARYVARTQAQRFSNVSSVECAKRVADALKRLLPLPDRPDLQSIRMFIHLALEDACNLASKAEPTLEDLEYIRYLEREAKAFSAPSKSDGDQF